MNLSKKVAGFAAVIVTGNFLISGGLDMRSLSAGLFHNNERECKLSAGLNCMFNQSCFDESMTCPESSDDYESRVYDLNPYDQCLKDDEKCCWGTQFVLTQCAVKKFYEAPGCFTLIAACQESIKKRPCSGDYSNTDGCPPP